MLLLAHCDTGITLTVARVLLSPDRAIKSFVSKYVRDLSLFLVLTVRYTADIGFHLLQKKPASPKTPSLNSSVSRFEQRRVEGAGEIESATVGRMFETRCKVREEE